MSDPDSPASSKRDLRVGEGMDPRPEDLSFIDRTAPFPVGSHELEASASDTVDLSQIALDTYWRERSEQIYSVIRDMELTEAWPLDDQSRVASAIERLGRHLGYADAGKLSALKHEEMILVLGYIRAGRSLRLYHFFYERVPDVAVDLLKTCRRLEAGLQSVIPGTRPGPEEVLFGAAHAHLSRLRQIERTSALSRVFAPSNVLPLINALIHE